jgi:2-deoxy-D-gluconate 3-dehydrogenase
MTGPLVGRVAVVTGGGRGIGFAIGEALAGAGAHVVLAGRDAARAAAAAEELRGKGLGVSASAVDVRSTPSVDALFTGVHDRHGRLDVLVNNSGVLRAAPLVDTTDDDWDAVLGTNLRGTFACARAAGRIMVAAGHGKIINVASNFAFKGVPQHAAYCASKAALVSFTRTAAVEWAPHGVQVNAIAPGYVETDLNTDVRADTRLAARITRQIPAGRMGAPAELGPLAVLLAGPASDFMTGQTVVVDGGQLAR